MPGLSRADADALDRPRPGGVLPRGRLPQHRVPRPAAAEHAGRAGGGDGRLARGPRQPAGLRRARRPIPRRVRRARRRRAVAGGGGPAGERVRRPRRGVAAGRRRGARAGRRVHERRLPVPRAGAARRPGARGRARAPRRRGHAPDGAGRRRGRAVRRRAPRRSRRAGGGGVRDRREGAAGPHPGRGLAARGRRPLRVHDLRRLQVAARAAGHLLLHRCSPAWRTSWFRTPRAGTPARRPGRASTAGRCGSRTTPAASTSPPRGSAGSARRRRST